MIYLLVCTTKFNGLMRFFLIGTACAFILSTTALSQVFDFNPTGYACEIEKYEDCGRSIATDEQ